MSRIKYVHVIDVEGEGRTIRLGKGDPSGSFVTIPTPENDREDFDRHEWERVDYWKLPGPMAKSEFKEWWNEHKDDDPRPSPIPQVLAAMEVGEDE